MHVSVIPGNDSNVSSGSFKITRPKEKYDSSLDFNEIEFKESIKISPESLGGFFFKMTGCIIEASKEDNIQALKDKLEIMKRLLVHKIPSGTGRKRLLSFYKIEDEFTDHAAIATAQMYATKKGSKTRKCNAGGQK